MGGDECLTTSALEAVSEHSFIADDRGIMWLAVGHRPKSLRLASPRLRADKQLVMRALKAEDQDARAIIFTQYDSMQHQIVKELNAVGGWEVFEFNKQTAPSRRHRPSMHLR